jgi:hypothetical protein
MMKNIFIYFFASIICIPFAYSQEKCPHLDYDNEIEVEKDVYELQPVQPLLLKKISFDKKKETYYSFSVNNVDEYVTVKEVDGHYFFTISYQWSSNQFSDAAFVDLGKKSDYDLNTDVWEEGVWLLVDDLFGDPTPEVMLLTRREDLCTLQIFNYNGTHTKFVSHTYELNEINVTPHTLVKNKQIIYNSIGSQGIIEEIEIVK